MTEPMRYVMYTMAVRDPNGNEVATKPLRLSPGDFEAGQHMAATRGAELYRDIAYRDFDWRPVEGVANPRLDVARAKREANGR